MRILSMRVVLWFAIAVLAMSSTSFGQVRVSVTFGPPALPVYEQPLCPGDGYIWTPGYWAWSDDDDDYYWVPGTWILAPEVGYLWTPPYWAWADGAFVFYDGYWGPHVGFYGGVVYGFGYFGEGFEGGRWDHDHFYYNRSVTNVNVTVVHNVYNTTVINSNRTVNRVSYNGGPGGINVRPTPQQETAAHERHLPPASTQVQHVQAARGNPELRASTNRGKPPVAATARPGAFSGREAIPAREAGAPYNPPPNRGSARGQNSGRPMNGGNRPATSVHPNDLPPFERSANTGESKADKKFQQQQQKLQQKQEQERQKLQQKQEQEHQRVAKQAADEPRKQQMEQRHQQQTQQLQQRHQQQQQSLQQRRPPPPPNRAEPRPPK